MGVKMATTCLHWSQPIVHHYSPASSSLSPSVPSPRRRTRYDVVRALLCRNAAQFNQSAVLSGGIHSSQIDPCKSYHQFPTRNSRPRRTTIRSCSSSFFDNEFSDKEFSKQIEELVQKFEQDSETPLMVYVMILLANYTVHSMENSYAIAPPPSQSVQVAEPTTQSSTFDSSSIRRISIRKSVKDSSYSSRLGKVKVSEAEDSVVVMAEEVKLWESIKEEADKMISDVSLDHDTMLQFVSPVTANFEEDDHADYQGTELVYQMSLAQEPNNVLLLANYAQFLYLVARDYDRAEDYFKKATAVEPPDAEAYNKYATFLWMVRKDLWAAEETYLQAISADPSNTFYASNYARFLWNTGGEDTCFPVTNAKLAKHNNSVGLETRSDLS